jgi:hypothetical protein
LTNEASLLVTQGTWGETHRSQLWRMRRFLGLCVAGSCAKNQNYYKREGRREAVLVKECQILVMNGQRRKRNQVEHGFVVELSG